MTMLSNVFLKTLRDQRWPTFWFGLALVAIGLYTIMFYPLIAEATGLLEFIENLPEELTAMFGGAARLLNGRRIPERRAFLIHRSARGNRLCRIPGRHSRRRGGGGANTGPTLGKSCPALANSDRKGCRRDHRDRRSSASCSGLPWSLEQRSQA